MRNREGIQTIRLEVPLEAKYDQLKDSFQEFRKEEQERWAAQEARDKAKEKFEKERWKWVILVAALASIIAGLIGNLIR